MTASVLRPRTVAAVPRQCTPQPRSGADRPTSEIEPEPGSDADLEAHPVLAPRTSVDCARTSNTSTGVCSPFAWSRPRSVYRKPSPARARVAQVTRTPPDGAADCTRAARLVVRPIAEYSERVRVPNV